MRSLLLIMILLGSITLSAQRSKPKNLPSYDSKWLHFGFTIGLNIMDFNIQKADDFFDNTKNSNIYAIENQPQLGFHIGPISNLRLSEFLDLRALINLSFGQRDLSYWTVNNSQPTLHTMKIASTFIEFPLILKYKALRVNNYSPYLIGGVNPKIDLAARKKIKEEEMPKIRLSNFDVYYELGFGIDFYLTYFKFSTEIKYSAGIMDVLERDNTEYTGTIKKMNSRMIMLSFHFE
ncbi:MAG: hypothetical protein B6I20_05000 [Bacteroidetes bacterium 4572_117]|nr:MAG: hypothetical protein B6I20_05000 [Bacteroidetes bacterium 4572_117]